MEERKVVFTDYQKAELENSFKKFNPNKEGKISLESVHNLLNSLDTSPQPKPKMNQKGLILASNEQQEWDFDFFIKTIEETLSDPIKFQNALEQTFKIMDFKGTGSISIENLIQISEILNENITTEEEALRIIQRAEVNPNENHLTLDGLKSFLINDIDHDFSP